ncbi:RB-associated KRAB zinc finger protein-like [Trichomycterus rosablanca]|uniref:RB-associated KRAB zinc finger protein-like n=1 Tax=Trichomycterus rosablanca TaxID=2290929 RepID=UPI002F3584D5
MAHKSILAAFSPVLASLLPNHGSLLDLNSPQFTPETLAFLLEYMYTGTLPPSSQEKQVLCAAFHLQMEPLQQALTRRREEMDLISEPDQKKINNKTETESEKQESITETPSASSSFYPYSSDQPVPCSPSYEEVPVICHAKATGNNTHLLPTQSDNRTLDVVSKASVSTESSQDNGSLVDHFFNLCHSREDKMVKSSLINVPDEPEMVVKFNSKDITELKSNDFHLCLSPAERDQSSQSALVTSENPSSGTRKDPGCATRTSDPKVWQEIDHCVTNALVDRKPSGTIEDAIENEHQSYQFSNQRSDCLNAYKGHIRYHCLYERDFEGNLPCAVPNAEIRDSSRGVKTINTAEISLSATESSKSYGCSRTHPFQCSVCKRAFSQRGSLNRHMRTHLGVRPYSCPRCSMTFSRQYRVSEHMRVHLRSCPDPP